MGSNLLAFAVPVFAVLMWLEFYISRNKNRNIHQFNESVSSINVGIAERLSDIFISALFLGAFTYIYRHWAIFTIPQNLVTWTLLFLLTDFVWYWYHRFGHRVNLFWSAHVVHHQSDDFNYTTSVRITVFQAVARGLFWCVLPLLGFSPLMITVLLMVHGAYPFFTHTQLVGKLGWFEKLLVTPSHHRVHHSSNPEYLDKNYGDMLIIWDKIFGTFAEEKTVPAYGLTKPLNSHSFLWQHFHFYLEMIVACKRANGFSAKMKVIFGKPDDLDPRVRTLLEHKLLRRQPNIPLPASLQNFIGIQTILTICCLFLILFFKQALSTTELFLAGCFILVSVIYTGAMLERKTWVFHLELTRIILLAVFVYYWYPSTFLLMILIFIFAPGLFYFRTLNQQYTRLLFGIS